MDTTENDTTKNGHSAIWDVYSGDPVKFECTNFMCAEQWSDSYIPTTGVLI